MGGDQMAALGDTQRRRTNELDAASMVDEAVRSRIEDADLTREQMELARLQMLREASLAPMAQATTTAQAELSQLGG